MRPAALTGGGVDLATVLGGAVCVTRGGAGREAGAVRRTAAGGASVRGYEITGVGCVSRGTLGAGSGAGGGGGAGSVAVGDGRPIRRSSGGAAGSDDSVNHTPAAPSVSTSPAAAAKRRPTRRGSGSSSMITTGEPGPRRGFSENNADRAPAPAPGDVPAMAATKSSTLGNRSPGRLLVACRSASETCGGMSARSSLRLGGASPAGGVPLRHSYASAASAYWSAPAVGPRALNTAGASRALATTSVTAKSPTSAHSFASSRTFPDERAPWNTPRRCA